MVRRGSAMELSATVLVLLHLSMHVVDEGHAVNPSCSCIRFTSTHGKERGTFSSPDYPRAYPPRLDCLLYTFIAAPHEIVELVFTDFDIYKEHQDCIRGDYLKVYWEVQGPGPPGAISERSAWARTLCGTRADAPPALYSPGPALVLEFHTGARQNNATGFVGTYSFIDKRLFDTDGVRVPGTECDFQFSRSGSRPMQGRLYSPRYPSIYPNNVRCSYHFHARPHERVKVVFEEISLQKGDISCLRRADIIKVFDGRDTNSPAIAMLCNELTVDAAFVEKQKKLLGLFYNAMQVDTTAEYYKVCKDYDIEAHIEQYTDKKVVEHFLSMYKTGFLPKYNVFSIFYDELREQAISVFQLFFYAKDFETFYNTACWARVHLNDDMFMYTFHIAVIQREDTSNFVLPAPYEIYPELFINKREIFEMHRTKQQAGVNFPEIASQFGIVKENQDFIFYANYSDSLTYPNNEQRLAYFTEDVGLNSFYYYFHTILPFWWNGNKLTLFKERRGEIYFYFYQQLLARYYLERLCNGLGEISQFSWFSPIKQGYYPFLSTSKYPFAQRTNNYLVHSEQNYEEVRFLDIYEKTFFQFLQSGHFKAFNKDIKFNDTKAINFVGNYWQTNADLYGEEFTKTYQRSYEITARRVLGAAPEPFDKYSFVPSALDFYQTSVRDPAFYQLYNKVFDYMVQYKEYLKPYNYDDLHYVGVKINDVQIDKLITYFDLYDFDATNVVFVGKDDVKPYPHNYKVRQPRLNHKPFSIKIDVKSDVATNAAFKIWIGPKFDSTGFPISLEKNWMNFVELDWFTQKLVPGVNKVERKSEDFLFFKEDSLPFAEIWKLLDQGKLPKDMSEKYDSMPKRLMLPKGSKGGFPYQIFVFAFPHNSISKEVDTKFEELSVLLDNKPFGYPLDRPVKMQFFNQPNMFFDDVMVYHEGEMYTYNMAKPEYYENRV